MTNLVAQARAEAGLLDHDGEPLRATLMRELADEIERLQALLAEKLPKASCEHRYTHGWGSIGCDGSSDGDTWCIACGKQLTFKRSAVEPPA